MAVFFAILLFFLGVSIGAFAEHFLAKKRRAEELAWCDQREDNLDEIIINIVESIRDVEDRVDAIESDLFKCDKDDTVTLQIPANWIEKDA